jgi:hypothetical protein
MNTSDKFFASQTWTNTGYGFTRDLCHELRIAYPPDFLKRHSKFLQTCEILWKTPFASQKGELKRSAETVVKVASQHRAQNPPHYNTLAATGQVSQYKNLLD